MGLSVTEYIFSSFLPLVLRAVRNMWDCHSHCFLRFILFVTVWLKASWSLHTVLSHSCALWRKRDFIETIPFIIHLIDLLSVSRRLFQKKRILLYARFRWFGIVQSSTTLMTDFEEAFDDFPTENSNQNGRSYGWIISRAINRWMDSCKWNDLKNSTTLWWVNFLVQVWGAYWRLAWSYSAWSTSTRTSTEEQTYLGIAEKCKRTSQSRISESRWWSQVFSGHIETPLRQGSSKCFPLEILFTYSSKERKHGDGRLDRQVFFAPEAFERFMDGLVTVVCHESATKRESIPGWCDPLKCRKT